MRRHTPSRRVPATIIGLSLLGIIAGCDRTQTVSITAEDFRFVPDLVRVTASTPLTLSVYNAGREVHEFDSPILMYAAKPPSQDTTAKSTGPGIAISPGQSLRIHVAPPPGAYLYICRRKVHADMTGTLIVE